MTTLDSVNPDALYVPGLRFWKQTAETRHGLIAQNANGAVEIWHAAKDPTVGAVLAHSPTLREGYEIAMGCSILGGSTCYTRESFPGYTQDFYPLLLIGRDDAVLKHLAVWHDETFARRAVIA
jgi:hypothetical protein